MYVLLSVGEAAVATWGQKVACRLVEQQPAAPQLWYLDGTVHHPQTSDVLVLPCPSSLQYVYFLSVHAWFLSPLYSE
jgi:hypothetical protein